MRLLHLTLPVSDVASVAAYFHDVLQQRVVGNHVHIGWSTIELQPAGDYPSVACTWPSTYRTTASARRWPGCANGPAAT